MSKKREQLIETALRLFNAEGFHATGIDRIIEEAGVARMTLYKHFKSKDELILAAMQRRDEEFGAWFTSFVESRTEDPRERLLVMFDALDHWFRGKGPGNRTFVGCMFIKAAGEFGAAANPVHKAAAVHKKVLEDYVAAVAEAAGADDARTLAKDLMLLKEGAIVTAYVQGDKAAARRAKAVAATLIDAAIT